MFRSINRNKHNKSHKSQYISTVGTYMGFSVISKALFVGGLLHLTPNLYPFSSGRNRLREAKEPGQGHTAGKWQRLSASKARRYDQESGLSPESLWASRLDGAGGGHGGKKGGLTRTASAKMQRRQNQGVSRGRPARPAVGMWHGWW